MKTQQPLLSRDHSTLSFHIHEEQQQPQLFAMFPKDERYFTGLYIGTQIVSLGIQYAALQDFTSTHTITEGVIGFAFWRSVSMVGLLYAYLRRFEPTLINVDPDSYRLVASQSLLQLIGNLSVYFAYSSLKFSQAATFQQLTPALIILLTHFLVAQKDPKIFLLVGGQIMMCLLFEADLFSIFLMLLSPICVSLMTVIRQAIEKPINQFTLLFYGNGINIVFLIAFIIFSGKVTQLFTINLFAGAIVTGGLQLLSFIVLQELAQYPIIKWLRVITAAIIGCTVVLQLAVFGQPLPVIPLFGQLVIVGTSMFAELE